VRIRHVRFTAGEHAVDCFDSDESDAASLEVLEPMAGVDNLLSIVKARAEVDSASEHREG